MKPMLIIPLADFFAGALGAAEALTIPAGIMMPAAPIAEAFKKSLRTMFQCLIIDIVNIAKKSEKTHQSFSPLARKWYYPKAT